MCSGYIRRQEISVHPNIQKGGQKIMSKVLSASFRKTGRRVSDPGNMLSGEERLIFLIAIQAYQDMVHYKRELEKRLNRKGQTPIDIKIEQQYRYSIAFFLHPWGLPTQSYAAHLFSLIGRGWLMRRIQKTIRRIEAEVQALERTGMLALGKRASIRAVRG